PYTVEVCHQLRTFFTTHRGQIDAVATIGDMIAMACIRFAIEVGLRVPDDVAVVGHDGIIAAEHGAVPLSTVTHDSEQIGTMAFDLLLQQMQFGRGGAGKPIQKIVPPHLVPRASTLGSVEAAGEASAINNL